MPAVSLDQILDELGVDPTPAQAETIARLKIVQCAREWIGTRYHLRGQMKGVGADCGSILFQVAKEQRLIDGALPEFQQDWWLHATNEKYMRAVMRFAKKVSEGICYRDTPIKDGCFLLSKAANSRFYNHGGIVIQWPRLVHAVDPKVEECDATVHPLWALREIAVFDLVKT